MEDSSGPVRRAIVVGCGIAGPVTAMFLQRAGIDAEIYERSEAPRDEAGAFLNLAPNGVNALASLEIADDVAAIGNAIDGLSFHNAAGKQVGTLDSRNDEQSYGARQVILRRGVLNRTLREAAIERGVSIEFGKRLESIEDGPEDDIRARFADGTSASANVVIGCDGVHSRTRQLILPDSPAPAYTGIVDCGGITSALELPPTGAMRMTFGRRAFFSYLTTADGETYWFSNVARPEERGRAELAALPDGVWRETLLDLHAGDPDPIPRIIAAAEEVGRWPIHDLPTIPAWHRGRVCLAGDAAHATSPHAGQGAATAIEDGMVLAKCLRDLDDPRDAFRAYERLRRSRVERLVRQARQTGKRKAPTGRIGLALRDALLPVFLRLGARSAAKDYAYRIDWDDPVPAEASA